MFTLTVPKHLVHNQTMEGVEIYTDLLNELGKDRTYWQYYTEWQVCLLQNDSDNIIQSSTGQELVFLRRTEKYHDKELTSA
jgi:hypothetical protein